MLETAYAITQRTAMTVETPIVNDLCCESRSLSDIFAKLGNRMVSVSNFDKSNHGHRLRKLLTLSR